MMLKIETSLLLLGVMLVPLLGVLTWGLLALVRRQENDAHAGRGDGLLLAMLALAAFSLGVFLAYIVMGSAH